MKLGTRLSQIALVVRDGVEQEAWRPRVFLRLAPRDIARDRQDEFTLRCTVS